jgi:hypothetical protein
MQRSLVVLSVAILGCILRGESDPDTVRFRETVRRTSRAGAAGTLNDEWNRWLVGQWDVFPESDGLQRDGVGARG